MTNELSTEFLEGPLAFMEKHFINVAENVTPFVDGEGLARFTFSPAPDLAQGNVGFDDVRLDASTSAEPPIFAHWLRYERGQAPIRQLGRGEYFFTVSLNACTFGYERDSPALKVGESIAEISLPRVAHIAGDLVGLLTWRAESFGLVDQEQLARVTRNQLALAITTEVAILSTIVGVRGGEFWRYYCQNRIRVSPPGADTQQLLLTVPLP